MAVRASVRALARHARGGAHRRRGPLRRGGELEQRYRIGIRDGDYWYDGATGAWGLTGGPALGIIDAGVRLGGALRADASGGGSGGVTGVFVNGRELHPTDVQGLNRIAPVVPGRYWLNARGVGGREGMGPEFDLVALAAQRGGGGGGAHHCLYCADAPAVGGEGGFMYYLDKGGSVTSGH